MLMFTWAWFTLAGSVLFTAFHDSALIPIMVELRLRRPADVSRFLGSVLAHALALGAVFATGAALVAWAVFAVRYTGVERADAAAMLIPFAAHTVMMSVRMFFGAVLNSAERYQIPAWATGIGMGVTLGVTALGRGYGVVAVPMAFFFGELMAGSLCAAAVIYGLELRPRLNFERTSAFRELSRLLAAEVGGQVISRVNPVVDQLVASFSLLLGAGTILRYANDVALVPTSLLQAVLLSVLLSKLSIEAASGNYQALRRMLRRTVAVVTPTLVLAALVLYFLRVPLLTFLFEHGEMDPAGVEEMIRIFPLYLLALPPFGALLVLYRGTVALKDSRILPWMGLLNAGLTLVLDLLLFQFMDIAGVALAKVAACTAVAAVFWIMLERRLRPTMPSRSATSRASQAPEP
jgi:putative peptidoglycan lipid II flippase